MDDHRNDDGELGLLPTYNSLGPPGPMSYDEAMEDSLPSYDAIVYDWMYDANEAQRLAQIANESDLVRDGPNITRLRTQVAFMSIVFILIDLFIVVGGAIYGRDVGTYTILNLVGLAVFFVGASFIANIDHRSLLRVAEVFFLCLWVFAVVAAVSSVVFVFTVPSRVDKICREKPDICGDHSEKGLVTFAVILAIFQSVGFLIVFVVYCRHVLVLIGALNRYYFSRPLAGRLNVWRLVFFLGMTVPDLSRLNPFPGVAATVSRCWRSPTTRRSRVSCEEQCMSCLACNGLCDCVDGCVNSTCSGGSCDALCSKQSTDACYVLFGTTFCVCWVVSILLCLILRGAWQSFFCSLAEIGFRVLAGD